MADKCGCDPLTFVSLSADPLLWTADQVIHWAVWVMKEFNIDEMEIGSIHIAGRELCAFSQEQFLQKVPNGEILWSHLELLRKCKSSCDIWNVSAIFENLCIHMNVCVKVAYMFSLCTLSVS